MLQSVRDYLREMNVAEQLADAMFRVEPEHIKYLTYKAVKDFGLTIWDPVYKEMMDVTEAKKLGITRQEYMVRRSRALRSCGGDASHWMDCYVGVMTNTRMPPPPPAPAPGEIDYSQFGEPVDWSREPLR
jgi:hypothetical protein